MNSEYRILITTRRGRTWTYLRAEDGWVQRTPGGARRRLTAEQLLSHLLPPLAGTQPSLSVRVQRATKKAEKVPRKRAHPGPGGPVQVPRGGGTR